MDERLKFVARRLAGDPMADLCREFGISRRPATRSSIAISNVGCRGSLTAADALIATPINFPFKWRTTCST